MKVYHQAGHQTVWNIDSFEKDNTGNGIIFSPVNYSRNKMVDVSESTRETSLFDPQFYVPDSDKGSLKSYNFFPGSLMNEFKTTKFEAHASKSAELCLKFQVENKFESIIVPARGYMEHKSNFVELQKSFTVEPFLDEIKKQNIDKKVYLTLPITASVLADQDYRDEILNWITGYPQVTGVYLMCYFPERSKQLSNFGLLWNYMSFIKLLKEADLEVIIGYCNTESLLFSCLDPNAVCMGAYENTRMFNIDRFLDEPGPPKGPVPRLYMPKLLNWIRIDTLKEIKEDHQELWQEIYSPEPYSDEFLEMDNPHFTQNQPYKHQFIAIGSQLNELSQLNTDGRIDLLKGWVNVALDKYEAIAKNGIRFFDDNCKNEHLVVWNRILKKLAN